MDHDRCLGCGDWSATRRGVLAPAARAIRIPELALPIRGASRREFLAGAGALAFAAALASCGGPRGLERAIQAGAESDPSAPILVSLYLEGGNDGLNTLVPLAEPRYRALRRRLAVDQERVLPLPDSDAFGWHPALRRLAELYAAGKVAVLPSVDFAEPDLSHFNSVEYWRTGIVGHQRDTTGWLGRAVDLIGSPENPLQALSVQDRLDPVLATARMPVATVVSPSDYTLWLEGVDDERHIARVLADLAGEAAAAGALSAARDTYANVVRLLDRLAPLTSEDDPPPGDYPDSALGRSLQSLARMLDSGFGTRVAAVAHTEGYDTHEEQADHHEKLLGELDRALGAWQADLARRGLSGRVLTLVWSEFGRRPADNDSNGTDHGAGGLVLVVGDRANGGIRSEFPGLGTLDENDNMRVSTEFRAVYATLLEDWMGLDAAAVLPGALPARLPLVAAA